MGAGAVLAGLLTGCASTAGGHDSPSIVDVVASTDVWGSVASAVGGRWVAVTSIISDPTQDPHSYQAGTRTLLAVKEADLLLKNGGGYDDFMDQLISSADTKAPVLDAVTISGHTAPPGAELNEHVWYDLPTVERVADKLAAGLSTLAPRHAADFAANAHAFVAKVRQLIAAEGRVRDTEQGVGVGITEPVPLYMLEAMGLRNLTPPDFSRAIEEGEDLSPRVLAETLDLFSSHQVAALVYNAQTSGPITEQVEAAATAAGVPVVPVTETLPEGTTYLSWMTQNVHRVAKAVAAQ